MYKIGSTISNNFSERSRGIIKNIGVSILTKGSNIICSLLIVPLTIDYINPERYGIWLTISSIIGWIVFFDLGLGNGFRNNFVKAKANSDHELCRQYVSTTYICIGLIVTFIWIIAILINKFIDWASVLNISQTYNKELHQVFFVVSLFTCLSMIVNVFSTLLTADLRPGISSIISAVGQWGVLLSIIILKHATEGNLINLACVFSGIPCLTMLISSLLMFRFTRYRIYRPSLGLFRRSLLKSIIGLGLNFFIIYLCMIALFQIVNLVISREIGPLGVTQYNIVNKYFSIIYMLVNIIMIPIWSAVTDAYSKDDYIWLNRLNNKLNKLILLSGIGLCILLLISPCVYKLWIGNKVLIPFMLSLTMSISYFCQTLSAGKVNQINGFGKLRLQTTIFIIFALISWPMFTYSARYFGLNGIVLIPAIVYLVQGIVAEIQTKKILNKTASGIWIK